MNYKKYCWLITVVAGSLLLVPICSFLTMAESSQPPVKLKVLLLPYLSFAPFFIAEEEGYFTEQGLEIEFVKLNRSAEAIPALIQGKLDVVAGGISVIWLNAINRGGTIKVVADKGYVERAGCPYLALLARKPLIETGALQNARQLQGKRIATNQMNIGAYYAEKKLRTIGLSFDDLVTKYNMPSPVRLKAIESNAIDIVNAGEPWLTRILKTGNADVWVSCNEVIPDFQLAVVMYGPRLLEENQEAGRRFIVSYLKAVQQYNQGKTDRNVSILAKYTQLDRGLLQEMCWPPIRHDGMIDVASVLEFQEWALEKGWIDKVVTEDRFWEKSFIEYANQTLEILSE